MTMKYIRDTYNVPAKRGMYVEIYESFKLVHSDSDQPVVTGWILSARGEISGSKGPYLRVNGKLYHPTAGVVYLEGMLGCVLLDTRGGTP